MKTMQTTWQPAQRLITTTLSGLLDEAAIGQWHRGLLQALEGVEDNSWFRILVNLHGFKAANLEAHKKFRTVIPLTLADYGWRVGYLGLFPEAELQLRQVRGISCRAAAHVHQDETKITLYDTRFGGRNERFFTDPAAAGQWIHAWQPE